MSRRAIKLVNWQAVSERVPETQRNLFNAYKAKSDLYLRRMQANPETPPKINWDYYRKALATPALADKFQKDYESYKVPFPADKYTSQIEAREKAVEKEIEDFRQKCKEAEKDYLATIAALEAIMPYDQMTMEDFLEVHPEYETGTVENPSIWPHTEETKKLERGEYEEESDH